MDPTRAQKSLVQWLSTPQSYADRPTAVEHLETHISHVFLAGKLAYKLKKPVQFEFLDFSSVANRERACREELRLNRRLAAEVYQRIVPVVRSADGRFEFGDEEDGSDRQAAVDWLVEMRRLPTARTLDVLLTSARLSHADIERLADHLVGFYRSLPPLEMEPEDYRQWYERHVRANFQELLRERHQPSRSAVQCAHEFQLQLLRLWPGMFDARVRSGYVVDGHGDLRPEHICLSDPIAIFDCIEFNSEFRRIDVADELAFLTEECDCLNASWVGPELMTAYEHASGDAPPAMLFDFYKVYRACVRAKVATLRTDQLEQGAQQTAERDARAHLTLAEAYAGPWHCPLVLVVGGLSGTGKSTLASRLAAVLGAELLRTDLIRKQSYGAGSHPCGTDDIYRPEARKRVYDQLIDRLVPLHAQSISVVLDGTFSSHDALRAVQAAVVHPRAIFMAIQCTCSMAVARRRIGLRLAAGTDASDARPELHDVQFRSWESWPADLPQIKIDTEQPLDAQLQQVLDSLGVAYRSQAPK